MNKYESRETEIYKKIIEDLKDTKLHLLFPSHNNRIPVETDFIIANEENLFIAVIELKLDIAKLGDKLANAEKKVIESANRLNARFAIITDGKEFLVYDTSNYANRFKESSFESVIQIILKAKKIEPKILVDHFNKLLGDYPNLFRRLTKEVNLLSDDCIEYENCNYKFRNEEKIIDALFELSDCKEREICRYTSLNTLFEMLKNKTIRMFGLAGMNDSSEVNFVENCIYQTQNLPLNEKINKYFITSCCSKENKDNLTFYRLYAENAKGVCLVFRAQKSNKVFSLRKVKYLKENDELFDFLKEFVSFVYKRTGYSFVFKTLHKWAHFIKAENYSVEDEIRLLYESSGDKDGWIIAKPVNVINPYKEIKLDDFPLQLKEIILGPKCPESEVNKFQIETLLKESNFSGVTVTYSGVKNYR